MASGDLVGGRYRRLELRGGGMGTVYRAADVTKSTGEADSIVALKVVLPLHEPVDAIKRHGAAKDLERFQREIRIMQRLDAPGLPRVLDSGHDEASGQPYLIMEYIDGLTLNDLVGDALPVGPVAAIGAQLADALAVAHRADILHRDLKRSNVMLLPNGRVKLIDFGVGLPLDLPGITSSGTVVGSKNYMAPEQLSGGNLDGRTDLYGLGCLLYELLCEPSASPFTARRAEQLAVGIDVPIPALTDLRGDVPPRLAILVAALLDPALAGRPETAEAVAEALWEVVRTTAATALPARFRTGDPAAFLPDTPTADHPSYAVNDEATSDASFLNVFEQRTRLVEEYANFTGGGVIIDDPRIQKYLDKGAEDREQWPDPYVALNPAFAAGGTVPELIADGLLHDGCDAIFRFDKKSGVDKPLGLYRHQREALEVASREDRPSYVLTTGTGSGKSLSYLLPIVDRVLKGKKGPDDKRIRAILVYPMNALVNSQMEELERFLGDGFGEGAEPVTFARYTGQEGQEKRTEIRANPPDILLTNYVMLELMLTRREDRKVIAAAKGLEFLVFDELHTYRGRQGADVAWLIRRLKQACEAPDVQCVGTSATMSTGGTGRQERKKEVAGVAGLIFGREIRPEHVIEETLVRVTVPDAEPVTAQHVHATVLPPKYEDLRAHPLAAWIEDEFGLARASDGTYERRPPITVEAAAEELASQTGTSVEECDAAIRRLLLHGAKTPGRPLFAFKLHQFLSKGDHVYATLDTENRRYFTRDYQVERPGGEQEIYVPLSFCRTCGRDYYSVWRDTSGPVPRYTARYQIEVAEDDHIAEGYLHIRSDEEWPAADTDELLERLPDSWIEFAAGGKPVVKKARVGDVPRAVAVTPQGFEIADGASATWIPGRFRFCLSCGVVNERRRSGDFAVLATLNQEGRSTATSVLSAAILRELRNMPKADQKLLSFVDNRQDASLQAGHFNDLVRHVLQRAALHLALKDRPADEPYLRSEDVATAVATAMGLNHADYAENTGEYSSARQETTGVFRRRLDLLLHADLGGGWRITLPNLEQVDLLHVHYADLDELCADEPRWAGVHLLADATAAKRAEIVTTVLDAMRRELAIEVDCFRQESFEQLAAATNRRLSERWRLTPSDRPQQTIVYPGSGGGFDDRLLKFFSSRGKVGAYLQRTLNEKIKLEDRDLIIAQLLRLLAEVGILTETAPAPRRFVRGATRQAHTPDRNGYRLNAACLRWRLGPGLYGIHDRLTTTRPDDSRPEVNRFFLNLYRRPTDTLNHLWAREHTAQVPADLREKREKDFRSADLPVMYCSPTMELGVDIAYLNAVLMRNVPPTPANYAQRSGRAGRHGQPALIVTYCATGNSHDQYYFKNRTKMVSGSVTPPRLDLCNEDLITSHIQSIWLTEADISPGKDIPSTVDTSAFDDEDFAPDAKMPLFDDLKEKSRQRAPLDRTRRKASELLEPLRSALVGTTWWDEAWLDGVVKRIPTDFDHAFERWRGLYRAASTDVREQFNRSIGWQLRQRERDEAARREREARAQLRLLRNGGGDRNTMSADFNPFRYLASEGFLPGYSFPRLPLAAFIPGGDRREGDYIQRSRFIAITEFGPSALIYHEGERFEVRRVQTDSDSNGELVLRRMRRCGVCGCAHLPDELADRCEVCRADLTELDTNLLELKTVYTEKRDRITSDEEERHRVGYVVETAFKFVDHGERPGRVEARVRDRDGGDVATYIYGDAALVRRVNRRRRTQKDDGYFIDPVTGRWLGKGAADRAVGDASEVDDEDKTTVRKRVIPFVEDTHNIALLRLAEPVDRETALSVMYALERGIEAAYQLEDVELSAELPSGDDRTEFLLFVESSEGGAGVLRQFENDPPALARAARAALEICHFDPDAQAMTDRNPDGCAKACYDCLLSYGNQFHHRLIDRHSAYELLRRLAEGTALSSGKGESRTGRHQRLTNAAESSLERHFLDEVKRHGFRLPTEAQVSLPELGCRPDFVYRLDGVDVAVFVDGPHHAGASRIHRDTEAENRLIDVGWEVIRFSHKEVDDWIGVFRRHRNVFGPGLTDTPEPSEGTR
ncbi:protein kinase domain-containing protein [Phytomonospora endophytica]|uniref:Serine/threonine protein kinase/superfamily II DNA/RNA helicase/very-short-patch-repair endonuclease n=1 Tax=Phytomonospora endophytica TaxID=714109 RepID=A0A841FLU0_9ACTN|nr:DEAD/DEAH box helicase [Phytomonospora endophytica]MBB6032920.1 serine/threonine protein kinase/superfamily II DNA/RNA helicase/very-short-patch-repair endonuclease [Phytomonospora endophytica]GIG65147.1 RNA helicase [Phytomonospora endophytica]